jgi:putative DNA primase/helicase
MNDSIQKMVSALGGKSYGGGTSGSCFCPAHANSKTPALSVSVRDGRLLVNCKSGCSQEAVIAALKSRGLWPEKSKSRTKAAKVHSEQDDAKQDEEHGERFSRARGILHVASEHRKSKRTASMLKNYLSGRGIDFVPSNALLLPAPKSSALLGKFFPAMVMPVIRDDRLAGAHVTFLSQDGTAKLPADTPRKMYGAVAGGFVQLSKIDPQQSLIVGEGVETVLSAMQITGLPGLAAMSAPNLAKVRPPKCRDVIIAADNDKAGRKAAEQAARHLNSLNFKVRIALPPDGFNDFNDALRAARDADELADLRENVLEHATIFEGLPEARALTVAEVMDLAIPPRRYLLKPWLLSSSLNMMFGVRGDGKTYLALGMAHAIATGTNFLGWTSERAARVLYVDGELPSGELQSRLRYLGTPPDNLHILSRNILWDEQNIVLPDLATAEGRSFLDKIIEQHGSEVIILDNISALVRSGVENDAESWAPIQDWMMQHRFRRRTVIMLHHEGRSGKPRGTSKREDALDTIIQTRKPSELQQGPTESVFEISFTKSRSFTDTRPVIARFSTVSGIAEWQHTYAANFVEAEVIEMLDAGMRQTEIAKRVKRSKSQISRIAAKFRLGQPNEERRKVVSAKL